MGTLRWILLILGIVVIAIVYIRGRQNNGPIWPRREPRLDIDETGAGQLSHDEPVAAPPEADPLEIDPTAEADEPEAVAEHLDFDELTVRGLENEVNRSAGPETPRSSPPPAPAAAEKEQAPPTMLTDEELVVLHIIAPRGADFDGRALYSALQGSGFEKRRGDIFYCHGDEGEYMAVNALKPGTFPEEPDELRTRAIGLILRLSAADKPLAAFDEFLSLARYLNAQLDGRLCDSRRSSLTPQTVGYLRDEVQQYHIKHLKLRRS